MGEEFKELVYVMNQAQIILHNHPYNRQRKAGGEDAVNSIWLWGNGRPGQLPSFHGTFGLRGSVVTASVLLKGMARSAGMNVVEVAQRALARGERWLRRRLLFPRTVLRLPLAHRACGLRLDQYHCHGSARSFPLRTGRDAVRQRRQPGREIL